MGPAHDRPDGTRPGAVTGDDGCRRDSHYCSGVRSLDGFSPAASPPTELDSRLRQHPMNESIGSVHRGSQCSDALTFAIPSDQLFDQRLAFIAVYPAALGFRVAEFTMCHMFPLTLLAYG